MVIVVFNKIIMKEKELQEIMIFEHFFFLVFRSIYKYYTFVFFYRAPQHPPNLKRATSAKRSSKEA